MTFTVDHASAAKRLVEDVNGDRISAESTPSVVADLLEAQVRAMLAIADRLDTLISLKAERV